MKVLTAKGLIEMEELKVTPIIEVGDNHCKVAIEYTHHGELVKRSVHVDMLRPLESAAQSGEVNG
jgi:hypothetical protein